MWVFNFVKLRFLKNKHHLHYLMNCARFLELTNYNPYPNPDNTFFIQPVNTATIICLSIVYVCLYHSDYVVLWTAKPKIFTTRVLIQKNWELCKYSYNEMLGSHWQNKASQYGYYWCGNMSKYIECSFRGFSWV